MGGNQQETWDRCYQSLLAKSEKHLIPFQSVADHAPGYMRLPPQILVEIQKEPYLRQASKIYGEESLFMEWFHRGKKLARPDLNRALDALEASYIDYRVWQQLKQVVQEIGF